MSFIPEYSELNSTAFSYVSFPTLKSTVKLNDNQDVGFGKVLQKNAALSVKSSVYENNGITYYLNALVYVVFADLKGEIRQATFVGEITGNVKSDKITPESEYLLQVSLNELTIAKIVGSELTLDLKYDLTAVTENMVVSPYLTRVEGAYSVSDEISFTNFRKKCVGEITIDEEAETSKPVSLILSSESRFSVSDVRVALDNVVVEGNAAVTVWYLTEGENGVIQKDSFVFPFREEIEAAGANVNDESLYVVATKSTAVTAYTDEDSNAVLGITASAGISLFIVYEKTASIVTDLFSKEKELLVSRESEKLYRLVGARSGIASESLDFVVEELNGVITNGGTRISALNCEMTESGLTVSGIAAASAILDIDGSLISREFEIPFATVIENAEENGEVISLSAFAVSTDVVAEVGKVTVGVTVSVSAEIALMETVALITDVKEGEDKPCDYSAIVVYVAVGGENELTLAEEVNMTPDEIRSQTELTFPLQKNQKIVLYRQRFAEKVEK